MGIDFQGPASSLWRGVYRKAASLAETRAGELVRDHVYLFHRTVMGGGGDGPFVDESGDTMTGALIMRLPGPYDAGAQHVYGASTGAFTPTSVGVGSYELGLRFSHPDGGSLLAVRWYRAATGQTAPAALRLWDTTAVSAPVWTGSGADLAPFLDTAVGWKTAVFAAPPALVAAREYVISFDVALTIWRAESYTPTPDSPLVFVAHLSTFVPEDFPTTVGTNAYLLDPVVGTPADLPPAAHSGAIRLQNGGDGSLDAGVIAWRNAGDTADLPLTVNASNELTFNGTALATGSLSGYLPLAGGTLTGDVVLSEATPTVSLKQAADTQPRSRLTDTALAFGPGGSTAPDATLSRTGAGLLGLTGAWHAPSGTWDVKTGTAPGTTRLSLSQTGSLTLTPDAGVTALAWAGGLGRLRVSTNQANQPLLQASGFLMVDATSNAVLPERDNAIQFGGVSNRWTTLYAVAGAINTSSIKYKDPEGDLDPEAALAAVLRTPARRFKYKGTERLQSGYYLEEADPLFTIGPDEASPGNDTGILLAAIQGLCARLGVAL